MSTEYLRKQAEEDARLRARQLALYELMNAQPDTVVTGLVAPGGVSMGKGRGEKLWTLIFRLTAWRVADGNGEGTMQAGSLTVRTEVDDPQGDRLKPMLPPCSVVRLRVRIAQAEDFDCPQAVLREVMETGASDPELESEARHLLEPVLLRTRRFGKLELDRGAGRYEGVVRLGLRKISLALYPLDLDLPEPVLELAERLWSKIRDSDRQARDFAAQKLLAEANSWREEGEAPISAGQFIKRMKLEAIAVDEEDDGTFTLSYEDGELFAGHSIDVEGSFTGGFKRADF